MDVREGIESMIKRFLVLLTLSVAVTGVAQLTPARLNLEVINSKLTDVTIRMNHKTVSTSGKSYTCEVVPNTPNIIQIVAEGYEEHWATYGLRHGEYRREHIVLRPKKVPYLFVSKEPKKVEVYKDRKFLGETPFAAFFDYGEKLNLMYKANGYHSSTPVLSTVSLKPMEQVITLSPNVAGLKLETIPHGAKVFINNIEQADTTPCIKEGLKPATYQLAFELPGYERATEVVELKAGESRDLTVKLQKEGASLNIVTRPKGAIIYINDVAQEQRSNCEIKGLKAGMVTVRAELMGHQPAVRRVTLTAGEVVQVPIDFEVLYGEVSLATNPANVEVWVDGRMVLKTEGHPNPRKSYSDEAIFKVPVGLREFRFVADGYEEVVVHRDIRHRERTAFNIVKLKFKPNIRVTTKTGSTYTGRWLQETDKVLRLILEDGRHIPIAKDLISNREAL